MYLTKDKKVRCWLLCSDVASRCEAYAGNQRHRNHFLKDIPKILDSGKGAFPHGHKGHLLIAEAVGPQELDGE